MTVTLKQYNALRASIVRLAEALPRLDGPQQLDRILQDILKEFPALSMAPEPLAEGGMSSGGLDKLMEECGELIVESAKAAAFGLGEHPDGKGPLKNRVEDELADVWAASKFIETKHGLDGEKIHRRFLEKLELFRRWDVE